MTAMESTPEKHNLFEDAFAILWGAGFVALGLALYQKAMLVTGSSAGISLLLSYATGYGFGVIFFLVNLPFWYLAVKKMGWPFTLRTFAAVTLFSLLSRFTPQWVEIAHVQPLYAALLGGGLMGTGLLILFRHRAGLGGFNVLALYLQENFGIRAGYFSLGVDLCILALSFFVIDWQQAILSIIGAVAVNLVIAINHRPGRYMGMS